MILMTFCPESPSYLYLVKGDKDAAKHGTFSLVKLFKHCSSFVTKR